MAISAKFIADFSSFSAAVRGAETTLRGFEQNANKVGSALNRMGDQFSGRKIFQEATLAAKAVSDIGGASKLTEAEQRRLNATVTEALAKYKALGLEAPANLLKLQSATDKVTTSTKSFLPSLADANKLLGVFGASISIGAIVGFGKALLATGDELVRVADRTGLTTEEVQKLQYVAGQSGNSLDEMTNAIGKLQNNLVGGDKSAVAAVKALGLNMRELRASAPLEQMEQIAGAIGKVPDPATRAAIAMDLFGRNGIAILPTLTAHFKELGDEAPIMKDKTVRALDQAGDSLTRFGATIKVWAAESYNLVGQLFDRLVASVMRVTATLIDAQASVLEMAAKVPGGQKALDALGISTKQMREQAIFLTDAAKAEQHQIDAVSGAVRNGIGPIVEYAGAATGAGKALNELTRIRDQAFGLDKIDSVQKTLKAIGGIPGVAKMSAEQTAAFSKTLEEATSAAKRNGLTAIANEFERMAKAIPLATVPVKGAGLAFAASAVPPMIAADTVSTLRNADDTLVSFRDHALEAAMSTAQIGREAENLNIVIERASESVIPLGQRVKTAMSDSFAQLPQVILGAIQGGGSVFGAISSKLGGDFAGQFSDSLSKKLSAFMPDKLAKSLGGLLGPLGALLAPMVGKLVSKIGGAIANGIRGWFGTDEEARSVNPARDAFLAQFGGAGTGAGSGFMNLAAKLTSLTGEEGGGSLFRALTQADTMSEFNAAVADINAKLTQTHQNNEQGFDDTAHAAEGLNYMVQGSDEAITELGRTQDRVVNAMLAGFDRLLAKLDDFIARLGSAGSLADVITSKLAEPMPAQIGPTPDLQSSGSEYSGFNDIPEYHRGGMIRAHRGLNLAPDEVPIIAQLGERVLNREETSAYNRGESGAINLGGVTININGAGKNAPQLAREIVPELLKQIGRYNLGGSRRRLRRSLGDALPGTI